MTYTRTKNVNGQAYKYLVQSQRINGKVIQRHVKVLGGKLKMVEERFLWFSDFIEV